MGDDPTATMGAAKGSPADVSLTTGKGTGLMATMDAAKGSPPNASLPDAMDTGKGSFSTVDAAKGNPPNASLPDAMDTGKGSLSIVDAAKGANHDDALATAMDTGKGSLSNVDAAKGANHDDALATAMDTVKGSLSNVDAAKGANHDKGANADNPLNPDVDAAKVANIDDPLATATKGANADNPLNPDVDAANVANIDDPLADVDAAKGKLPIAATAAPSEPILGVAVARPPKFDIVEAQSLIAKKDWQGIDDLLCKFVGDCLGKDPQDAGIMHPGLLLIPREEKIVQLLQNQAFEEAINFCEKFIKPLKKCQSKFRPLSLDWRIDDLIVILNKRSAPERSIAEVGRSISDYMFLYFPCAMCNEPNHVEVGTWQFAMKLPVQPNQISSTGKSVKPRHGFRCLACGWTTEGTMSITGLKNHIVHSRDGKCCPNVTQDLLDRIQLIDPKDVPDLSTIATRLKNKKRKGASSGSTANQNTGSSRSAAGESPSFVAPTSKKKLKAAPQTESHTLTSSPAAAAEVLVADASSRGLEKIVTDKVDILRGIANFMFDIEESLDPVAGAACKKKAIELEQVAFDLKMAAVNSRPGTSLPAQNNALAVSAPSSEMLSKTDKV